MSKTEGFDADEWIEMLHRVLDHATVFVMDNLPHIQRTGLEVIDAVFAPSTVLRQLVLATILQNGVMTVSQIAVVVNRLVGHFFSRRHRYIRNLKNLQQQAETQDEWFDLAERIDNVQGNDVWRSDPNCQLYERERIQARIDEFVHLMRRHDIFELMFELRGGIARNKFGLLHEGLFSKAMGGSKVLVETYHNVVCAALDFVCDAPSIIPRPITAGNGAASVDSAPIPTETKLAFFNETRHSYGRTAVLLSGGAALGFFHVGVIKTLIENRLMPRVIGGSSAGSIVAGLIGTRTDEECLRDLFDARGTVAPGHSGQLKLNFFRPLWGAQPDRHASSNHNQDDPQGVLPSALHNSAGAFHDSKKTWQLLFPIGLRRASSFLYDIVTGARRPENMLMADTEHFKECVRIDVGDFTFQEAFDRTGRILNITVTPNNSSDPPRLLNYLTAPHVLVWSAVVASSALPGVFEPSRLKVRDADGTERYESAGGAAFSDGSMEQDLPMQQLGEMFNVNHFIISQVNVHAVLFASYYNNRGVWANPIVGLIDSIVTFLKDRVRTWVASVVELVGARRIAPLHATSRGLMSQLLTQDYVGRNSDISLIPWINHFSVFSALMRCLYNPTDTEFRNWVKVAERETWKHIPAIKSHIAEEVTLDRCVQRLRKRLLVESWQKRTRQNSAGRKMGERVPSFFTSPSLVNLGGLGVGDQTNIQEIDPANTEPFNAAQSYPHILDPAPSRTPDANLPNFEINSGWQGQGLRGNRSNASLNRTPSATSGIFIDGEEPNAHGNALTQTQTGHQQQHPGEDTATPDQNMHSATTASPSAAAVSNYVDSLSGNGYIKTTSMAKFYYRKTPSYGKLPRSRSHGQVENKRSGRKDESSARTTRPYERRKSKSHTDFNTIGDDHLEKV